MYGTNWNVEDVHSDVFCMLCYVRLTFEIAVIEQMNPALKFSAKAGAPALQAFIREAGKGAVIGTVGAIVYKVVIKDPTSRTIDDYYKAHPVK